MDGIAQWTKFLFSCKVYFNLLGMGCIDKKSIPKKYGIFEIEIKYGRIMVHSYHSFLSIQCKVGSTYQLMFQEKKLEKSLNRRKW